MPYRLMEHAVIYYAVGSLTYVILSRSRVGSQSTACLANFLRMVHAI